MLFYYLRLAWKSIIKSPVVSVIIVTAIALGIGVATTILSMRHIMAANPIPEKSDQLFNVRLDSWELATEFFGPAGEPPKHITYQDMERLRKSDIPTHQSGIGAARAFVFPEDTNIRPYSTFVRLCHPDFFPMFNVPMAFGSAFTEEANTSRQRVTVISHETNQRLFDGEDSVGKTIRIGTETYTIVGVLAPYKPTPQYYDVLNNSFGKVREFIVPFNMILEDDIGLNRATQTDGFGSNGPYENNEAYYTRSESHWIQFWVQLDTAEDVSAYRTFVDDYARDQKQLGRFPRPLNSRVLPVMAWLEYQEVSPPALNGMVIIAILFLVVCALNLMGLLLGKFLAGANFVGVRRALGATKSHIFVQHLFECVLVGVLGGAIGIFLAHQALRFINRMTPTFIFRDDMMQLDMSMLIVAFGLSLVASLIAGIYPAWRACNIAPAVQIKLQ